MKKDVLENIFLFVNVKHIRCDGGCCSIVRKGTLFGIYYVSLAIVNETHYGAISWNPVYEKQFISFATLVGWAEKCIACYILPISQVAQVHYWTHWKYKTATKFSNFCKLSHSISSEIVGEIFELNVLRVPGISDRRGLYWDEGVFVFSGEAVMKANSNTKETASGPVASSWLKMRPRNARFLVKKTGHSWLSGGDFDLFLKTKRCTYQVLIDEHPMKFLGTILLVRSTDGVLTPFPTWHSSAYSHDFELSHARSQCGGLESAYIFD